MGTLVVVIVIVVMVGVVIVVMVVVVMVVVVAWMAHDVAYRVTKGSQDTTVVLIVVVMIEPMSVLTKGVGMANEHAFASIRERAGWGIGSNGTVRRRRRWVSRGETSGQGKGKKLDIHGDGSFGY